MNWTARTASQKAEAIRGLLEQHGLSFSQAAKQLGTTRLAVAGVAHRHGIEARGGKPIARPAAAAAAPALTDAWRALPGTDPRPVEQHRGDAECRWPIGTSTPFRFCCAPVQPGKVYRPAHAELGLRPAPPIKFNGKRKQ